MTTVRSCPPYNAVAQGGIKLHAGDGDAARATAIVRRFFGFPKIASDETLWKMGCALRTRLGLDVVTYTMVNERYSPRFLKFLDSNPKELLRTLKKDCVSAVEGELSNAEKGHARPFCASAIASVETYLKDAKPSRLEEYKPYIIGAISMIIIFVLIPHFIIPYIRKKFGKGKDDNDNNKGNGDTTQIGYQIKTKAVNVIHVKKPGTYEITIKGKKGKKKGPVVKGERIYSKEPDIIVTGDGVKEVKKDVTEATAARIMTLAAVTSPVSSGLYRPLSAAAARALSVQNRKLKPMRKRPMTPQQMVKFMLAGMLIYFSGGRSRVPHAKPVLNPIGVR